MVGEGVDGGVMDEVAAQGVLQRGGDEEVLLLQSELARPQLYSAAAAPLSLFYNGAQMQRVQLLAVVPMSIANVALSLLLTRSLGAPGPARSGSFQPQLPNEWRGLAHCRHAPVAHFSHDGANKMVL